MADGVRALEASPRLSLPKEVMKILIYSLLYHVIRKRLFVWGEPKERRREKGEK